MKKMAFIVVFVSFLFFACDDGNDNNGNNGNNEGTNNTGKLTIIGLSSIGTQAVYVFNTGTDISSYVDIVEAYSEGKYISVGASIASGNIFTLFRWVNNELLSDNFSNTGSFPVLFLNTAGSITDSNNPMYSWTTVSFSNGVGSVNYNQFEPVMDDSMALITIMSEIASLANNSKETPHNVVIEGIHLRSLTFDNDSFGLILSSINGKYINLDLSGCRGTELKGITGSRNNDYRDYMNGTSWNILSVKLPESVRIIGSSAFLRFYNLSSIELPNSLIRIEGMAFWYCPLGSIILPETLVYIGGDAFASTELSIIDIPASVSTIGNDAFMSCSNLKTVIIRATTPPMFYLNIFRGHEGILESIYVPDSSVNIYKADINWSQYSEYIKPLSTIP